MTMGMTSKSSAPRPLTVRSAITNDPLKLRGVDGRSETARRFRDVAIALTDDCGGADRLSEPTRLLIRQAAMLTIQVEQLQAKIVAGEDVDHEQVIRLSNVLTRVLAALGLKKCQRRDTGPSLADYLQSISDRQDTEVELDADAHDVDGAP